MTFALKEHCHRSGNHNTERDVVLTFEKVSVGELSKVKNFSSMNFIS